VVTPSIVCNPDNVIFAVVANNAGFLNAKPKANESTYSLFTISEEPVGAVVIVPVDVEILVNAPVDGVVAPIVVLLIVLLVMFNPL
jgi:hypothetical protein